MFSVNHNTFSYIYILIFFYVLYMHVLYLLFQLLLVEAMELGRHMPWNLHAEVSIFF